MKLTSEQQKLVEDHVRLVGPLALRHATNWVPYEDRVQDGMLGLIDAAKDWDPSKGLAFSTYAYLRIRGAILDAARAGEGMAIRIPRTAWQAMSDEERRQSQPRTPIHWRRCPFSTRKDPRGEDVESSLAVRDAEPVVDGEKIRIALRSLGKTAAAVVELYALEGLTLREAGERLGLSQSRMSQVWKRSLERLRDDRRIREASIA